VKKKLISILIFIFIAPLFWLYLKMIMWFSKITVIGEGHADELCQKGKGHTFVFWHNQQFILPQLRSQRNIHALVSDSRDGDYMAWLAKRFGKTPIRGSSSRKGVQALKKMIRLLKSGAELAIATDGPRGPAFEVKPGAVQLAASTGTAIIPVAYYASKRKEFSSWDESFIPFLFGHLGIVYGDPVFLDRSTDIEQGCKQVKEALDIANQKAREIVMGNSL